MREGQVVDETMRVAAETGAEAVFLSEDVSAYAQARERRLGAACAGQGLALHLLAGVTAVPPGDLAPAGGDFYKVFTPYWRRWQLAPQRALAPAPRRISVAAIAAGRLPALADLTSATASESLPKGGETEGRRRVARWLSRGLEHYDRLHDSLADDGTSRLGPYLHFGCLSPLELVERARGREGAEPFVRQLCWRDFYAQLLAARPETSHTDFRPRGRGWRDRPRCPRRLEGRAAPASRSSTPACGSSRAKAGCTTGRGCSQAPSWPRTSVSTGASVRRTSSTCSSMATSPATAATGSGSPAPASTRVPTASSTRSGRPGGSTPTARTCAATCRSWPASSGRAVHEPWKLARLPDGYPEPILDPAGSLVAAMKAPVAPARHLLRAKDLADARYFEPLDVATLAGAARLSPAHFSREFRRVFGESPHQYLLTRRLERAAALLRCTDRSVADICITVGLRSIGSFTTSFTRAFGMSPTAYRATYPPAAERARIPTCILRAYARPRSSTSFRDEG